jgi:DNA-binding CsgD family transcriptional regulator
VLPGRSSSSTLPYRALISPLERVEGPEGRSSTTWHVLMQYAPHGRRHLPKRILVELYGLTSAEAALVELLLQGQSLDQAAAVLGVTIHTVKSHLKDVFARCQVHSQGELLQLLTSGPRTL